MPTLYYCKHAYFFVIEFIEGHQPQHHLEAELSVERGASNTTAGQPTNTATRSGREGYIYVLLYIQWLIM